VNGLSWTVITNLDARKTVLLVREEAPQL